MHKMTNSFFQTGQYRNLCKNTNDSFVNDELSLGFITENFVNNFNRKIFTGFQKFQRVQANREDPRECPLLKI